MSGQVFNSAIQQGLGAYMQMNQLQRQKRNDELALEDRELRLEDRERLNSRQEEEWARQRTQWEQQDSDRAYNVSQRPLQEKTAELSYKAANLNYDSAFVNKAKEEAGQIISFKMDMMERGQEVDFSDDELAILKAARIPFQSISRTKHLFTGWCPLLADADTCVQRSLPRTDRR